jgi:hypothetical protein
VDAGPARSKSGDNPIKPRMAGDPPALNVYDDRLLAGGAGIHVDFHANRHFNDLRCFPSHFGSPSRNRANATLRYKVLRKEKFASEIFCVGPVVVYAAAQPELHGFVRLDVKPMLDQEFDDRPRRMTSGRPIRKRFTDFEQQLVSDTGSAEPLN